MKNVRDRCAHGNLLANDIDETYLFIEKIKSYESLFVNVFNELSNLLDSETIDSFYEDKVLEKGFEVENNLPEIEYDETGFIGRIKVKQRIDKTLNKNSIIVLTGDAGIGKTSLILDKCNEYKRNTNLFDEIKWFTFKTQKFSDNEIIELNKSLYASEYFESDKNKKDLTNNLIKYIQSKKCLLILDNLETVLDQSFKDFLDKTHEIDHESKIIITSREPVDSGVTIKVEKFDNQEAESLFRKYSNYLTLENLKKLNSTELELTNFYKQMLLIRRFEEKAGQLYREEIAGSGHDGESTSSRADADGDCCRRRNTRGRSIDYADDLQGIRVLGGR